MKHSEIVLSDLAHIPVELIKPLQQIKIKKTKPKNLKLVRCGEARLLEKLA